MPSAIVETPSVGDAISAPLDADPRNAASVRTPLQAVGNRLKFWENQWLAGLKAWILGGTIAPAGAVTLTGTLNADELAGTIVRGGRRQRMLNVTGDVTVNYADGVDLIMVHRSDLAVGTTTITLGTSGFPTGYELKVAVRDVSASKDVVVDEPLNGSVAISDSFQGTRTYTRVSGGWELTGISAIS